MRDVQTAFRSDKASSDAHLMHEDKEDLHVMGHDLSSDFDLVKNHTSFQLLWGLLIRCLAVSSQ